MPNFTKKAIRASFIRLLGQMPLSQISVRRICEDCGVNRNSFYYHYHDIPALIEEIVRENTERVIEKYPTVNSLDDCLSDVFCFLIAHKKEIYHIYNSVNREIYDRYLMQLSDYILRSYLTVAFSGVEIPEKDRETVIRFFKCEIFGLSFDWIMNGMWEDAVKDIFRITGVCRGLSDDLIARIRGQK